MSIRSDNSLTLFGKAKRLKKSPRFIDAPPLMIDRARINGLYHAVIHYEKL